MSGPLYWYYRAPYVDMIISSKIRQMAQTGLKSAARAL